MSNNYDQLKYEFWKGFVEYANSDAEFAKYFTTRKPHIKYWYDLSLGISAYHICLTVSPMKKERLSSIEEVVSRHSNPIFCWYFAKLFRK